MKSTRPSPRGTPARGTIPSSSSSSSQPGTTSQPPAETPQSPPLPSLVQKRQKQEVAASSKCPSVVHPGHCIDVAVASLNRLMSNIFSESGGATIAVTSSQAKRAQNDIQAIIKTFLQIKAAGSSSSVLSSSSGTPLRRNGVSSSSRTTPKQSPMALQQQQSNNNTAINGHFLW